MEIKVTKYTDVEMLHRANSFSTSKDSYMDLATAYCLSHSPIRTQRFEIELRGIPQFVANQLVRQRQGVEWVMKSKRKDRGGEDMSWFCFEAAGHIDDIRNEIGKKNDLHPISKKALYRCWQRLYRIKTALQEMPKKFDRYAPTDLWCDINAEALMNMAHKRLCGKSSKETREIVAAIRDKVAEVDPYLAKHMVPQCIYRGGICPEAKTCGYINSEGGQANLHFYRTLFTKANG